jgi:hypothetical protein
MKLYYFNPNGFGEEAFVCAESKEKAIEYLLKTKPEGIPITDFNKEYHENMLNNMTNELNGYSIDEFKPGEVVFSEIC